AEAPKAASSSRAVRGVICLWPLMIALTAWKGRPRISARSRCDQPRASSSSRMNAPGGNTSAIGQLLWDMGCSLKDSVIIFDRQDDDHVALGGFLDLEDQTELIIQPHRILVLP